MTAGTRSRRVGVPGFALAGLVLLVLAIGGLAPVIGTAQAQRRDIEGTEAHIAAQQARIRDLDARIAQQDDPAHLRQEAGSRLFLVMPGGTTYRVVGAVPAAAPRATEPATDPGWASRLLQSVVAAGGR